MLGVAGAPPLVGRSDRVACAIVAYKKANRVERAIRSVADLVDETLLVDSGSTDETVAQCERFGARVVHQARRNRRDDYE